MPTEREKCDALATRHPNVILATQIFQSDDESIDGGVCRGMASRWIGAHLLGRENIIAFRALAENKNGKIDVEFVRYQAAFNAVAAEFTSTRERAQKLMAEAVRLTGIKDGTVAKGWFESTPTTPDVDKAAAAALKAASALQAATSMLHRYMSGGLNELMPGPRVGYATFTQALGTHLTGNGFYYIGLGGTHAIAFYVEQAGKCMFIDANTGEWLASDLASLAAFFSDYMQTIYGNHYAGVNVATFSCPAVVV
ncbi:Hypothetical protein A7982_07548 [Minicystis rosea]|nr:Hypothetical protein A7982_07548 [Minicystis rosea]